MAVPSRDLRGTETSVGQTGQKLKHGNVKLDDHDAIFFCSSLTLKMASRRVGKVGKREQKPGTDRSPPTKTRKMKITVFITELQKNESFCCETRLLKISQFNVKIIFLSICFFSVR